MNEIIKVPDLGGEGDVIEIFVKVGDKIEVDTSIVMLESSKASMEIPSPKEGIVKNIFIKIGDTLEEGQQLIELEVLGSDLKKHEEQQLQPEVAISSEEKSTSVELKNTGNVISHNLVFAGPGARALAREMNVDLTKVSPTGLKSRITKEDVISFKNSGISSSIGDQLESNKTQSSTLTSLPNIIDFSKFGDTEEVPLSRLMQAGSKNLTASWQNIPHVTYSDDVDITELEAYRKELKSIADRAGVKVTVLPFLMKCLSILLYEFPNFNSSLSLDGKTIILKKYVNIGFAVDTPDGLLVPVIKDIYKKGVFAIAKELVELADKARNKQLKGDDMSGGCFTVTSLGHIGGTNFTPIINAPEVAILGVTRSIMKPVYNGKDFDARLMLPLSLSFDHRIINGADGARFMKRLSTLLSDLRMALI